MLSHSRAIGTLRSIEARSTPGVAFATAASLLADAWSVVDSVHRIRELIEHAPIFPKNETDFRIFLAKTEVAEELRHYVQHLAGKAKSWTSATPFWGVISWSSERDPTVQFTLVTSDPYVGGSLPGLIFDRQSNCFISTFQLEVAMFRIDLNDVADRVSRLDQQIEAWTKRISFEDGRGFIYWPDSVPLIVVRVSQADQAPHPDSASTDAA
jgi:hypothetical protein